MGEHETRRKRASYPVQRGGKDCVRGGGGGFVTVATAAAAAAAAEREAGSESEPGHACTCVCDVTWRESRRPRPCVWLVVVSGRQVETEAAAARVFWSRQEQSLVSRRLVIIYERPRKQKSRGRRRLFVSSKQTGKQAKHASKPASQGASSIHLELGAGWLCMLTACHVRE